MASESGVTEDGLFKKVYVDGVQQRVPSDFRFQKKVSFDKRNRVGRDYTISVLLQRPNGGTRALGATALTAFTLNTPRVSQISQASVVSAVYMDRSQLPYFTGLRTETAEQAFAKDSKVIVDALKTSVLFNKEVDLIYGAATSGIGTVSTNGYTSGTTAPITLTTATWAPMLWAQMLGAGVDVYTTGGSKRNTGGALTVSAVDPSTYTITLSADSGSSGDVSAIAPTDYIFPYAGKGNQMTGLDAIATNTGSIYGIDGATYESFKGNTADMGSTYATIFKIGNGLLKSSTRTFEGEWEVLLNPWTFEDLINDQAALRRYADSTRSEMENGTESIKFYGAAGTVNFEPYALIKSGEAYGFRKEHMVRVGTTEFLFTPIEGAGQDARYLMPLANNAGYEFRAGWDETLFCDWPASVVKFTNIVNQSQV